MLYLHVFGVVVCGWENGKPSNSGQLLRYLESTPKFSALESKGWILLLYDSAYHSAWHKIISFSYYIELHSIIMKIIKWVHGLINNPKGEKR